MSSLYFVVRPSQADVVCSIFVGLRFSTIIVTLPHPDFLMISWMVASISRIISGVRIWRDCVAIAFSLYHSEKPLSIIRIC